MPITMASQHLIPSLLFTVLLTTLFERSLMYPFPCSTQIKTCNALLYRTSDAFTTEEVASFYSVNMSEIKPIAHAKNEDLLINVPCTCWSVSGFSGYFYGVTYKVGLNDTFLDVSNKYYNGQAWRIEGEDPEFPFNTSVTMHLVCGCVKVESQVIVTYTVQYHDTLSSIATLLSAKLENIESLNRNRTEDPSYIQEGWVLFVPMEKNGIQPSKTGELFLRNVVIEFRERERERDIFMSNGWYSISFAIYHHQVRNTNGKLS